MKRALIFFSLLGKLPLLLRRPIGWYAGYLIGLLPLRDRYIADLQLKRFLPNQNRSKTIPKVYASIGQTTLETLKLAPILDRSEKYITCHNTVRIKELLSQNRPIIALTAHTGNWELMAAYMVQLGVPLSAVGRAARKASLQTILASVRAQYGVNTLWRTKGEGLKILIRELEQNRTVAALIDQDTRVSSTFSPFFGTLAHTPSGLIAIGKRHNAIFVTAFNYRVGGSRYQIEVQEIDSHLSTEQILSEYHRRLEIIIRQYPEQWVWFHKRWRTLPERGTLSTTDYLNYLRDEIPGDVAA